MGAVTRGKTETQEEQNDSLGNVPMPQDQRDGGRIHRYHLANDPHPVRREAWAFPALESSGHPAARRSMLSLCLSLQVWWLVDPPPHKIHWLLSTSCGP